MTDQRRGTSSGAPGPLRPRGRSGPGRGSGSGRGGRLPVPAVGSKPPLAPHRPRLTGRAAILVLVLAVLAVSYASSMRAYLQQRAQISDLLTQIDERKANISKLEREKRRYEDPAFVRAQARERFGYVMPGERSYVVLDEDGEPLDTESSLSDPSSVVDQTPDAWWGDAWASVELAGNPPKPAPVPLKEIDGSDEPTGP